MIRSFALCAGIRCIAHGNRPAPLEHLGLACVQVGEVLEHRGLRAPYLVDAKVSWELLAARSDKVAEMFARHYLGYLLHAEMQPLRLPSNDAAAHKQPQRFVATPEVVCVSR